MSCDHVEELAAVAAGLPLSAALEAHLAGCGSCRAELAELQAALALADEALRPFASAEPSPALRARIREAAAAAASQPRGWAREWTFAWTTAAAVVVLATALVTGLTGWRALSGSRPTPGSVTVAATPSPERVTAVPSTSARVAPGTSATSSAAAVTESDAASAEIADGRPALAAPAPGADRVLKSTPQSGAVAASRRAAVGQRPAHTAPRPEPEVLVPAGEEQALLRFVALVHEQDASPAALLAAGEPSADLAGPDDIHIEPLEIVPLDPAEALGT